MGRKSGNMVAVLERLDELATLVAELTKALEDSQEENRKLRDQLEAAQRASARQAAPFRRREAKKKDDDDKKPPGRKVGHKGTARKKPDQIDHEHEIRLDACPDCGGVIHDVEKIVQYIEEIPPIRPVAHRVVTYQGRCDRCGEVRSTHPLQTSRRPGVQLGPRASALAGGLNKDFNLTMRKTCRVLKNLLGLSLSPGGLSQMADRLADRASGQYDRLIETIRGSPACNADETSWWVGGPGWWLWTFTTPSATVYRVEESRASKIVEETLGDDYQGVLGSDCLSSYNPIDCRKHKCIAHHLKAIKEAQSLPDSGQSPYLRQWKILFKSVVVFHRMAVRQEIDAATLADKRRHFEAWVDKLLTKPVGRCGEAKIRNRLAKQRPHLLTCLYDLHANPTNNAAERSLRPAVIARKLSCGNKTLRGKRTWEILASLAQSLSQQGRDFIAHLAGHAKINAPAR